MRLVAELLDTGEIDQHGAQERNGDSDRAEKQILVGRLERGARPLEVDEEDRGERGALDRDPHEPDVVGGDRHEHREHEEVEERIEAAPRRLGQVARGLGGGEGRDDADQGDHPPRKRIGAEEPVERDERRSLVDAHAHGERRRQGEPGRQRVQSGRDPADRSPQQHGADQGHGEEDPEHHPRSSRKWSTSIESCSRRTWTTTASMISTITSTSRKTPASTMPGSP